MSADQEGWLGTKETVMKAFLAACLAAIALAAIWVDVLSSVQQSVGPAFATPYARVST